MKRDVEEVGQLYGIGNWSNGYFSINRQGHVAVHPEPGVGPGADLYDIVQELIEKCQQQGFSKFSLKASQKQE